MSEYTIPSNLSLEAFKDLKEITYEEFGASMSDDEIHEMGTRLLRLFELIASRVPVEIDNAGKIEVSDQEFMALKFLHNAIYHDNKSPSVREVCLAMGMRSSRSGFRMIRQLESRGFVYRNGDGKLELSGLVKGCRVKFDRIR